MKRIGIIAGRGDLTRDVIESCAARGYPYHVLAYVGHSDPALVTTHPHTWVELAKVGQSLAALHQNNLDTVVIVGYFERPTWHDLKPDLKGALLLAKLIGKPFGDDSLFRVLVQFFEKEGFTVMAPDELLGQEALMSLGCLTIAHPDTQACSDIKRGFEVAKALGAVDVGQAVVVQQGLILGVEAIEGSDELINRCTKLKRDTLGGVFVKVIKPGQETRVDRSVIGPQTIENAHKAGLRGVAAEAGHVILLNKEETLKRANELGLFVVGVTRESIISD